MKKVLALVLAVIMVCTITMAVTVVGGIGSDVADNALALNGHPDTYFGTKDEVNNAIDTANASNELVNELKNTLNASIKRIPKTIVKSATITNGVIEINLNEWLNLNLIENILTIHAEGDIVAWDFSITNASNTSMTIILSRQQSETTTRTVTFLISVVGWND